MGQIRTFILVATILLTSVIVEGGGPLQEFLHSQDVLKDKMMDDLDIIKNTFSVKYAPVEWKQTFCDWNLDEQIEQAKVKIQETEEITVKDFQRILKAFFHSTHDYHVGISFYSTEFAFLPFCLRGTEGKYYISWVYPEFFSDGPRLNVGDEVLFFNDRPAHDVIQEFKCFEFGNSALTATDQALAEYSFTNRLGLKGHLVPQGPISVTVRHAKTTDTATHHLSWIYSPEEIHSFPIPKGKINKSLTSHRFFNKDMTTPLYTSYKAGLSQRRQAIRKMKKWLPNLDHEDDEDEDEDEDDNFLSSKKSCFPELGRVIWQAPKSNPFYAYIFVNSKGRRIGLVRIPHYCELYDSKGMPIEMEDSVKAFTLIIKKFQSFTDAMIVDQMSNPGGYVFYLYALASTLSDKPLILPTHRMTLTQEDVSEAVYMQKLLQTVTNDQEAEWLLGKSIMGYPVTYESAQSWLDYSRFIIDEWNTGHTLSQPFALFGINYLPPSRDACYTKPILFLVNELDFSCGDFLPAILQDNQRAVILGTRTAGAGGCVLKHQYPNLFGIKSYRYTGSIAQRVNENPIENLGVSPDRTVIMTERDLEEGYADYISRINQEIDHMLN